MKKHRFSRRSILNDLGLLALGILALAWTVPIFQFPGVTAWSDTMTNLKPAFLAPQYFWNFWEWAPSKATAK